MKDTSKSVEQRYKKMLMSKTGAERLEMASSMHETARQLILSRYSGLTNEIEVKKAIFEGFYSSDFSIEEKAKILNKIKKKAFPATK